jgi:hypothetical protein
LQPPVEFGHAAVELVDDVAVAQEFNRPQQFERHRFGIGLRFLAQRRREGMSSAGASRAAKRPKASELTYDTPGRGHDLLGACGGGRHQEAGQGLASELGGGAKHRFGAH